MKSKGQAQPRKSVNLWQNLASEHFNHLLNLLPDAIIVCNAAGVLLFVNHQTETWFQYERGELEGQELEVLIPERFRKAHQQHRKTYVEKTPIPRPMGTGLA